MRYVELIAKIGSEPSVVRPVGSEPPVARPVEGTTATNTHPAPAAPESDHASLSETAAIVNRMRALAGCQGGIRPHVVAQLKHDLALGHTDRKADIERAICRLLQEL